MGEGGRIETRNLHEHFLVGKGSGRVGGGELQRGSVHCWHWEVCERSSLGNKTSNHVNHSPLHSSIATSPPPLLTTLVPHLDSLILQQLPALCASDALVCNPCQLNDPIHTHRLPVRSKVIMGAYTRTPVSQWLCITCSPRDGELTKPPNLPCPFASVALSIALSHTPITPVEAYTQREE